MCYVNAFSGLVGMNLITMDGISLVQCPHITETQCVVLYVRVERPPNARIINRETIEQVSVIPT